jgi:hypothetical protein
MLLILVLLMYVGTTLHDVCFTLVSQVSCLHSNSKTLASHIRKERKI